MPLLRGSLILGLALAGSVLAGVASSAANEPKIGKPIQVPPTKMPPLLPAVIDNSLLIGGEDINARKVSTRMTVEVHVNGRGPYQFLVDSGADSSVVGLRIAQDLQLPLGSPTILHATTASARVDRVMVDELRLGGSIIQNMEVPALREQDLGGQGMIGIDALVEQRLMIGRPLCHPDQRLAAIARSHIVEEIGVPEASPVRDAFGVDLIDGLSDLADFVR